MVKEHEQLNAEWERLRHFFKREEIAARTILLEESQVSERMFYIEKGCIRLSFNHEGKDILFSFSLKVKVYHRLKVSEVVNRVCFPSKLLNLVSSTRLIKKTTDTSFLTEAERPRLERMKEYKKNGTAYLEIQSTRPQTIAYSPTDSPVGQKWKASYLLAFG